MAYARPTYDSADVSWDSAETYSRPSYNAASVTFEDPIPSGAAFGSSTVLGISPAEPIGTTDGISTVVGQGLTNRGDGLSSGISTVFGNGMSLVLRDGQAQGWSSITVQNAQNTANGVSLGVSNVLANNALALCYITGSSYAFGNGSFLSRFSPQRVFPGLSSNGTSIIIPISSLPGISVEEAGTETGDWRKIFQSMLICLDEYLSGVDILVRPQTISSFLLENWNAEHRELDRGVRRNFSARFNINYVMSKIVDED
jgi:hypothetical protein